MSNHQYSIFIILSDERLLNFFLFMNKLSKMCTHDIIEDIQ